VGGYTGIQRDSDSRGTRAILAKRTCGKPQDEQFEGRPFHGGKKRFTAEDFEYGGKEDNYRALYGRRMRIIEPCFGDILYNKRMNQFSLRGKIKVNIQWLLYCMVHDIGKYMPGIHWRRAGVRGGGSARGLTKDRRNGLSGSKSATKL
jgi:hypothetical protein